MNRGTEYKFVPTDSASIVAELTHRYEEITQRTLHPADPDKLFIQWIAGIIIQTRHLINYTGNQNIPSRAVGENLDALGEMIFNVKRPEAAPAECMVRFEISEPQETAITIPKGTRVTDPGGKLIWRTVEDAAVGIGAVFAEVGTVCDTAGPIGNGYVAGQINTLVDVDNVMFYASCANTETSHSGRGQATDAEYYELMRASLEAYSTAGPKGAYEYHAKAVSSQIGDVCAIAPLGQAGVVNIFAIMSDGAPADDGTKRAILEACNDEKVRPLTDYVEVLDPEIIEYDVDLTFYIDRASQKSISEIQAAVEASVDEYTHWQSAKIGRDINFSHLMWLLKDSGAKRIDIRAPVFTELRNGSDRLVPQVAKLRNKIITNGGYEDE